MTQIVGNVVDVGLAGVDGTLRVWAWFRPEEVGLIAPYRREWEITGGEIEAGVDVIPGPAAVEIDCGPNAYTTVDVMVPDADLVTIQDLFEQVYSYTPGVVSEAWEARRGAEAAALEAELSADEAAVSAGRALTSEEAAALSAATLSARIEQSGQDILYTRDGKPYLADPATIKNTPLTVDETVGTRVMLGTTMLTGSTGWRDITGLLINGWEAMNPGGLYMIRDGSTVTIVGGISGGAATDQRIANIPYGFRTEPPTGLHYFPAASNNGTTGNGANIEYHAGWNALRTSGTVPAAGLVRFTLTAITTDNWPTSLPGVPA